MGGICTEPLWCHFGSRALCAALPFSMALVVGGEPDLVVHPGLGHWVSPLTGALLGVFVLGVATGWFLARTWLWIWDCGTRASQVLHRPWARLVLRLLHFVRRRRLISFAFSNYKNHQAIGQVPKSPKRARRARPIGSPKALPGPPSPGPSPLIEGPVIQHGSYRSRVGEHEHPRRRR